MANHISHASLPYIVRGAKYTIQIGGLGNTGAPAAFSATGLAYKVSIDGAAVVSAANTATAVDATNAPGMYYLTLTGAETDCSALFVLVHHTGTPSATVANKQQLRATTRQLPVLLSGTASAGAAGSITLAAGAYDLTGCIVKTTGGTGGGGTGGANNQARVITAYNTSTLVATVSPNWETTPDSTTTYNILISEMSCNAVAGRFLRPATDGRTLVVDSNGLADANTVKIGPTGSGTAQTARDIGASVVITSNVKKNQALSAFMFLMTDSTGHAPATGKTVSVTRSIDGAAFGAGTLSAVTEVANGIYKVDFAAADLNGNNIILRATATGCDDTFERVVTQP